MVSRENYGHEKTTLNRKKRTSLNKLTQSGMWGFMCYLKKILKAHVVQITCENFSNLTTFDGTRIVGYSGSSTECSGYGLEKNKQTM